MTHLDRDALAAIRADTELALLQALGDEPNVAILDAPNQRNVGDSLIWAGQLAYLGRIGKRVRYVADRRSYDAAALRRVMPRGIVLIHGGGNFGDIWETHQKHREELAAALTDYRIVQLPQSVFFNDAARAAESNIRLAAHPDLRVLVRDEPSIVRMSEQLPDVTAAFCPDMALGWAPPRRRVGAGARRALVIAREDIEGTSDIGRRVIDAGLGSEVEIADWRNTGLADFVWRVLRLIPRAARRSPAFRRAWTQPLIRLSIRLINDINIRGGLTLLTKRRAIVVDRLHAHVMATLLDVPNALVDNSYGKLRAIFDAYSHRLAVARYFDGPDDAVSWLQQSLSTCDLTETGKR